MRAAVSALVGIIAVLPQQQQQATLASTRVGLARSFFFGGGGELSPLKRVGWVRSAACPAGQGEAMRRESSKIVAWEEDGKRQIYDEYFATFFCW